MSSECRHGKKCKYLVFQGVKTPEPILMWAEQLGFCARCREQTLTNPLVPTGVQVGVKPPLPTTGLMN